jgi:hypothetical protein
MCVFCKIKHSFTLYLSTLYLSLVPYRSTDSQTRSFLKFPELSGQVGISRIPSKNADRTFTNLSVNTLLLSQFHKHSFTPYPSISGQVGISSIPSKNADGKITNLSGKHSFTLSFS